MLGLRPVGDTRARGANGWVSLLAGPRSLQKVQGHRAGVDVDVTPPTGGRVGHPPNSATLCDRSAQGSKS